MSENLKYFETLQEADGYLIKDIPFVSYIDEIDQVLYVTEPNKMIVVENNQTQIIDYCILKYTAPSKETKADNLGNVHTHNYDSNTGNGVVIYKGLVTSINNNAFEFSNITSITIPNSVTSIGVYALAKCYSLKTLVIPDSVTTINASAFQWNHALESVTIGNSVTTIGVRAFDTCKSLTSVIIPDSVTNIKNEIFWWCENLTSVTFGSGLTKIGNRVFGLCRRVSLLICKAINPPIINSITFDAVDKSIPLYVPEESISTYQQAEYWSEFTNIRAISSLPSMVDLGLPSGTLWCKYNIGVNPKQLSNPEDWYGNFYAWGELTPKDSYTWDNYKFGTSGNLTKYNTTDNKTILDPEDDICTVTYGNGYRMPTYTEIQELIALPNEWVTNYQGISGLNGRVFTGRNGNTLFIPAAGYQTTSSSSVGNACRLWINSLIDNNLISGYRLNFSSTSISISNGSRYRGQSVRCIFKIK